MQTVEVKRPDVVGRAAELATVPWFLDALAGGSATLVFEGDAGIGKTTLWTAGVERCRKRGYHVLSCRAAEAEMQLPFAALGDLLAAVSQDLLDALPAPQRRALDVAMVRADWDGPALERRAVAVGFLSLLRLLAEETPTVIALDDLQWLDPPSAAALRFALRRLQHERVGLLATRRGLPLEDMPATDQLRRVEVGPLDLKAVGRMLRERSTVPLTRPALLQLHRVSAGNPFLALEIARALERHEVSPLPGEPFPVPRSLRELMRDRLDGLPPEAHEVALIVASLLQPTLVRVDAAGAATGVAAGGLSSAIAAGIVEVDQDRVRFTHPLIGSIIYSEASAARRRALHAQLAALTDDVEERARHLALAATGPAANVAATLDEAAAKAIQRGAPEAAAELYAQAVELTPHEDQRGRHRRGIDAAEAWVRAGDAHTARLAFDAAVDTAPERRARAHALTRLGAMLSLDWQPDLAAAAETYERARRDAGGEPALVGAIELDLAWLSHFRGDLRAASEHALRAAEVAEKLCEEDQTLFARALVTRALMEGRRGNGEANAILEHAFALQEHVRHHQFGDRPQFVQALFLAGDGRFEEARASVLAEYHRAQEQGDEGSLPTLLEHLTIIERRAGNWEDAERYAREMQMAAERVRFQPGYHSGPYVWILALRGRVDEARALAERDLEIADAGGIGPIFGGHRAVLGFIALSLGDARGCADVLEALSSMLTSDIAENGWLRFLADEIEARVALGELDRAAELVDRLAERRGVLLDAAWARAATERCRGLVHAAAGDEVHANASFARALRKHEGVGEPFELARTLLAQGRVERRFKRRRASRDNLTGAREIFSSLGAPLWVARTDEELERIGGRAPRPHGLTPTEERIAALAAEGRTNREIAATLFLSVNTVQAYLKRIYRELGVRSRTELARQASAGAVPSRDGTASLRSGPRPVPREP